MALDYTAEYDAVRAILTAGLTPSLIAWPGDSSFKPPKPSGDPENPNKWYDVDLIRFQNLDGEATQQLDFGGSRARKVLLEVGICYEAGPEAERLCAAEAETLEGLSWTDTDNMVYRLNEAWTEDGVMWQGVWWLVPWKMPIERYD